MQRPFPTPDWLDEIAASSAGDLAEVPFAVLLLALARADAHCVLEIRRRQLKKTIVLESGSPVQCRSNVLHDTFAHYLKGLGLLSEQEHAEALETSLKRGVPFGEVLIERGLLSADEVLGLLQKLLAKVLLACFAWADGTYTIRRVEVQVQAPLRVRVHQLILTGLTRLAPQKLVDLSIERLGDDRLIRPEPSSAQRGFDLGPAEQQILSALDRPMTLRELEMATSIETEDRTRAVYALGVLALIAREPDRQEAEALASGQDDDEESLRLERTSRFSAEEISDLFLNHRRLDAFDLLKVEEGSSNEVIDRSYLEYVRGTSPWIRDHETSQQDLEAPHQDALQQEEPQQTVSDQAMTLLLAGARAYVKLSNIQEHDELVIQRHVEPEEAAAQEVQLVDPNEHYERGIGLMESGDYNGAFSSLEFASDCDPQQGLFRAQSAYCLYLQSPEEAERALDMLAETHRVDPTCGLAFLYAGEIAGQLERFGEAQALLRQASKLMAPDRRPIQKLRELNQLRQAKA